MQIKRTRLALLAALAVLATPFAAQAQWWVHHPHYARAMADLREAFWMVRAGGGAWDPMAKLEEHRSAQLIRGAYMNLRAARIVDNGDIDVQPPPDPIWGDHRGRLHRAMDLLRDAHNEIQGEEDDPAARGFRGKAMADVDAAAAATHGAIAAWGW